MFNFGDMELSSKILYEQSKDSSLRTSLTSEAKGKISKYRGLIEKALHSGDLITVSILASAIFLMLEFQMKS